MFLGEFSCLGVFYLLLWRERRRPEPGPAPSSQPFSSLLFLPPALCDMTGTSIMYVGECWEDWDGSVSEPPAAAGLGEPLTKGGGGVWGQLRLPTDDFFGVLLSPPPTPQP